MRLKVLTRTRTVCRQAAPSLAEVFSFSRIAEDSVAPSTRMVTLPAPCVSQSQPSTLKPNEAELNNDLPPVNSIAASLRRQASKGFDALRIRASQVRR